MPERVDLRIDGSTYRAWSDVEIHREIDSSSTVTFTAPFEPDRESFRRTFRPFSFRTIEVHVDGELVFTGTMIDVDPKVDAKSRKVSVSAYALPAVLENVNPPASAYPLEFNGLSLRQIAASLLDPFELTAVFEEDDGAPFKRVAIEPDGNILSFLADLAQQRNLVISDDAFGFLRFKRSTSTGRPVVRLREGEPPLESVEAKFAPQEYFSEITGRAKSKAGRKGSKYTVTNPHLSGKLRPKTFTVDDTDAGDLPAATEAKMGRMFGNMVAYAAKVPTWRDPAGRLWEPNTTLRLEAPGAMVYRETELVIRAVTLTQDESKDEAELALVLPGAFRGEAPTVLPWD